MVLFNAQTKYTIFSFVFTAKVYNFAPYKNNNRKKMDQHILEKEPFHPRNTHICSIAWLQRYLNPRFFASQPFKTQ